MIDIDQPQHVIGICNELARFGQLLGSVECLQGVSFRFLEAFFDSCSISQDKDLVGCLTLIGMAGLAKSSRDDLA
ncbi:hypothetical protein [Rosistilla ulvae]|uniref:hypothetical protein n=1 Tax=Rosistilla ulvae TaxID=1930277 RepID=UPI0011A89972|nr:hypothetical protein [Rosistilla ulvae]